MNENTNRAGSGGTAGALLLMAMCCLCMAVFAMLGMSSAAAHKRVSDACVSELEGYYAASRDAESDYAMDLEFAEPGTYSHTYYISEAQNLEVEYVIYGSHDGKIVRWAPVPAAEWAEEEFIEVIH